MTSTDAFQFREHADDKVAVAVVQGPADTDERQLALGELQFIFRPLALSASSRDPLKEQEDPTFDLSSGIDRYLEPGEGLRGTSGKGDAPEETDIQNRQLGASPGRNGRPQQTRRAPILAPHMNSVAAPGRMLYEPIVSTADDVPLLFTLGTSSSRENGGDIISINGSPFGDEGEPHQHCHSYKTSDLALVRAKKAKKRLIVASILCLFFVVGEVVGGKLSHSLAIMSDAAHMLSDFASFCISLISIRMSEKRPRKGYNFGFHRAEVVGALFTLMIIWFVTGILVYLAVSRLADPASFDVDPDPMLIVSGCAVLFNIILGLLLHGLPHGHSHGGHSHSHSHGGHDGAAAGSGEDAHRHINLKAATIHVIGDLVQSVGVLVSSIIIKVHPEAKLADPVCTLMFSFIVFCTTINVLRDTIRILMEGHPKHIGYGQVSDALNNLEHVVSVHDLRMWSLTVGRTALTVHLAVNPTRADDREKVLQTAGRMLKTRFDIDFTTIQVEDYNAQAMSSCDDCKYILR